VHYENLYKFPLKQTKEEVEQETLQAASQQIISATQQSRVDQVTTDLVQWMVELVRNLIGYTIWNLLI